MKYKHGAKDIWMVYELGGETIAKETYEMKGEFFKGERIYRITFQPLHELLFR
jgi:hypothetical protein